MRNPLGFISDMFGKIADKFAPDKQKVIDGQNRINEAEVAGGPASILRLWRGFLGWVLALMFAWEVIGRGVIMTYWPDVRLPPSVLKEISQILLGMLGLGL